MEVEHQKSFTGHTMIEIHQDTIHAKIESKLSAATRDCEHFKTKLTTNKINLYNNYNAIFPTRT